MPVPSGISTLAVENARADTAIQLAIDLYFANRNTITTVLY